MPAGGKAVFRRYSRPAIRYASAIAAFSFAAGCFAAMIFTVTPFSRLRHARYAFSASDEDYFAFCCHFSLFADTLPAAATLSAFNTPSSSAHI